MTERKPQRVGIEIEDQQISDPNWLKIRRPNQEVGEIPDSLQIVSRFVRPVKKGRRGGWRR